MLRLKPRTKAKACEYYSLPQDPYLEVTYHVVITLTAFCVLSLLYMFFQWSDFLIFLIAAIMLIFVSVFPLGQSRWGQIKAVVMMSFALWVSFTGVFIAADSRTWTVVWVFCFTLTCYLISLRDNAFRLYLGLSIVFLPIYIHLIEDATMLMPLNSIAVFVNYSAAIIICFLCAIIVALLTPKRLEAKVLLAMTEYIYALRRMLLSQSEKDYQNNLYCMYRHLYYLREQRKKYPHQFDQKFMAMMNAYIDVAYQIIMNYVYILNNHQVVLPFYQASAEVNAILAHEEEPLLKTRLSENEKYCQSLSEKNQLLKDALKHAKASLQKLKPLYQEIRELRKKYA